MPEDIQLSDSDGVFLVKTARMAVTGFLSNGNRLKLESEREEKFSFNSGVFVTLNNPAGLRGCIGFPMPEKKLSHAIIEGAIAAATEDPRFPSVKINELNDIVFEDTYMSSTCPLTLLNWDIEVCTHSGKFDNDGKNPLNKVLCIGMSFGPVQTTAKTRGRLGICLTWIDSSGSDCPLCDYTLLLNE